ncbi:hypothetical protein [Dactylosporangium sp. CA-233914]|uniref:hypothetical protein n=1 Tax=Dactylosporangium sp. CA-233914 TaxID=3239934 RepID=UPI003D8B3335
MTFAKPIETHYAGCRFRSRLEARWAVFLDRLGVEWDYEPEGYELPSGRYLPDFLLHLPQPVWLEIKPGSDSVHRGERRWADLVRGTARHLLVAYGTVRDEDALDLGVGMDIYCPDSASPSVALAAAVATAARLDWEDTAAGTTLATIAEAYAMPSHDPTCGFTYCGNCDVIAIHCPCMRRAVCRVTGLRCGDAVHPRIVAAHRAARSARFEWGESGA